MRSVGYHKVWIVSLLCYISSDLRIATSPMLDAWFDGESHKHSDPGFGIKLMD